MRPIGGNKDLYCFSGPRTKFTYSCSARQNPYEFFQSIFGLRPVCLARHSMGDYWLSPLSFWKDQSSRGYSRSAVQYSCTLTVDLDLLYSAVPPSPPDRAVSAKLKTPAKGGCFFSRWSWLQQIEIPKSCMHASRQIAGFSVDFGSILWWIMTENTHMILSAHCMKMWIIAPAGRRFRKKSPAGD